MLRRRVVLVLMLAVSLGLITSYFVYKAVVDRPQVQQAEMEEIVVAKANISMGEALTPNHIKLAPWPKAQVPTGSLRSLKDADGRPAKSTMVAGEPVLDSKLAPAGQGGLMPVLVPVGKRAVSIIVEQATQKSGFVVPNSRVDVLVTMAGEQSGGAKKSRIVLQDVTVLAADQTVEMKDNKPVTMTTVTMSLAPEEAERLTLAQNEGKVTLALRNLQDTAQISTPGITTAQLMGSPAPPPAKKPTSAASAPAKRSPAPARTTAPPVQPAPTVQPPPPPAPKYTVSVVRGTAETEQSFVQDPVRGWSEAPKTDATKKSR